jgi:hypothetical protein
MVRPGDLVVQATIDDTSSSPVVPGMPARVQVSALGAAELTATVDRVDPANGRPMAQFSVNWLSLPRVGSDARITVPLPRRDGVLLVPTRAVQSDGGRRVVEVIDGATMTPVEVATGLATETEVEIRSGLQEGQRVRIGP